jgi:hypothetical protein
MSHVVVGASHPPPTVRLTSEGLLRRDIMKHHDQPGCSEISDTEIQFLFRGVEDSVMLSQSGCMTGG